ncbi:hypothetical protein Val02_48210 [Virgisporangium aliadipatigenens]|uniref:Methyltransferase type 11 domain-containing protein n=1 Tax=Virgisporangium aliadipatigenens TaxID=741659 RepID=A0A8J4DRA5_9ACTN|nr:methyltransferase domain-containing protein [Virgisporangium aliadipatigenens]GIJ47935.1 hypothetical protein Val02_48210 [Virgisporangium aliadipatigenens]
MRTGTAAAWESLTEQQRHRWARVLDLLADAVPAGAAVVIDGPGADAALVADRLAATLRARGRACARLADEDPQGEERTPGSVVIGAGPRRRDDPPAGGWDVVVRLRTALGRTGGRRGDDADIAVDLHDPAWPVIRHIAAHLTGQASWYATESAAFFAARAATWDTRFGDDLPAYAAAVADAQLPVGGTVVDVGCGTGRALPALRDAVGAAGTVLGVDLTPQMLDAARARADACRAALVLADARYLPFGAAAVDAVFAAGLLTHLPDAGAGLRELARVTRAGGRLVLFHPSGRAALAARHGRTLRPDEPLSEGPLRDACAGAGWRLARYDDAAHRFLAVARRLAS